MRSNEEIIEQIKHIIDQNIKPAVASHGGVIDFVDYDDGHLKLILGGACSGCASSTITLKLGVENMLKHYIPEVNAVEGVDDPNFNDPYYTQEPNMYSSWENPGKSYDEMLDELEQEPTTDENTKTD